MLIYFVATISAGFAAAGIVLLLNRIVGGRLPRWLVPTAAGVAMIVTATGFEYSWYRQAVATLPEGAVVTFRKETRSPMRPWSYISPVINQFAAVQADTETPAPPGIEGRFAYFLLINRWGSSYRVPVLFDCAGSRQLDVGRGLDPATAAGADWATLDPEDPALVAICGGG